MTCRQDSLSNLRRFVSANPSGPHNREHYRRWAADNNAVTLSRVERDCGGWNAARVAVGLRPLGRRCAADYTETAVLALAPRFFAYARKELGRSRWFAARDWDAFKHANPALRIPHSSVLVRIFGSWNEAMESAGALSGLARTTHSREDIIAGAREMTEKLGHFPTTEEFDRERGDELPSRATVYRHYFRTWGEFAIASGSRLESHRHHRRVTRQAVAA
jgi:hypothetical protein